MRKRWYVIFAAVVCLASGWGVLFAGWILGAQSYQTVPAWSVLVVLAAAVALAAVSARSARTTWGVVVAVAFTAAALACVHVSRRDSAAVEASWWSKEPYSLAHTLLAVGDEFARLEALSKSAGESVAAWFTENGFDDEGKPLRNRVKAFQMLDSLAVAFSHGGQLTAGTEIGLQVFDASGRRIAWGGWPQALTHLDRGYIDSGVELVYSREVSLYRILTRIVPLENQRGRRGASVLVDVPLEVNYRVNNRFLKSTGLADKFASDQVANLKFDYSPNLSYLPYRLERFKAVQQQNLAHRERMIRHRKERQDSRARAEAEGGFETSTDEDESRELPVNRRRRVADDSVLTYFPFPAHIEPTAEITGDRVTGLHGRVLIRSSLDNPIVSVTATGQPFRHYAERYQTRWIGRARAMVVLALLVMFVVAMLALGRRGYHAWLRGAIFVGFLVLLRYSMLSLGSFSIGGGHKLFNPTVFATPILGGIMRSAGDLLITGVFFVIGLYGVMKMIRSRGDADRAVSAAPADPPPAWQFVAKGVVVAVVLYGVYVLARGFSSLMVLNANPRLIGETMRLTDLNVLVLHLGAFLTLTGILLAGMLVIWGMFRLTGWRDAVKASWTAFGLLVVGAVVSGPLELAVISGLLLLFVVLAPRYVQREDIVSIAIVSFCLVIITSGLTYVFFTRDYDELRKMFIQEQARDLIEPRDDWKRLILEDILEEYTRSPRIQRAFRAPDSPEAHRVAFDLWADALLSRLGSSCAIYVLTDQNKVVSDFSVDMPYRLRIGEGEEPLDAPVEDDWAVLDITRSTPQGDVRAYRGIVYVEDDRRVMAGSPLGRLIGKVVVDLPYFFESLEWASRTGPRTPEVLRNIQEGGVASRREEPEALLLARLDGMRIYESSSDFLPVGSGIPKVRFDRALEGKWPLLHTRGGGYRFLIQETSEPGLYLLAGFAVPSPLRHLIRWSTLFSLYLFYTAIIIVAIIALGSIRYLKELLPTLTPGRKFGFQQKLLASFLAMALVPAVLLGLFSVDFIKNRFVEENRVEALDKLFSARRALVNLMHGEMRLFMEQTDLERLFTENGYAESTLQGTRLVRVFSERGVAGPAPGGESANEGPTVDLTDASPEHLYILREGGKSYVGVLSPRQAVTGEVWREYFRVYFGRRIDADLLGEIADQINADVNVYSNDGNLMASSQEGLLSGGLISAIIDGDAYVKVSMFGSGHDLATEKAGQYSYQVAYLPVTSWGDLDTAGDSRDGQPRAGTAAPGVPYGRSANAVLSVPLLFLPESYSLEIQKATSIVLGIFALLFVATIGLGLLLARGVFEPLRALLEGTRRISRGDLNVRLPMRRSDEIGTVVSAFNEMTAQLSESQRALDERRRYLETILANIGTGVISTGADDRIRTVNSAAQRILGIKAAAAIGRTASEMVEASMAPEIFKLLREGRNASKAFIASEVELQRDGRRSTIKYMLTKLNVDDRYLGTVFVFEDLTELIQTKKLSAWVEMARQIAHEIKNPLTPIRISTQFMQRAYEQKSGRFDQIFKEGSQTIIEQVDVLKRIASEFSSYGRMQQLEVAAHKLGPLLEKIVQPYLRNASGVVVEMQNGEPDAEVLVDTEAMRKICTNLIENAMDAMPEGGHMIVSCGRVTFDEQHYVRVSFRDTGPGLNDEAAEKLFEPYFSTKTTGTGLGLAICRSLSREMGGDIEVRNVSEGGVDASVLLKMAP